MLGPDRSLMIAALPEGEDPDSLVRRDGAAAFRAVLAQARPLAEALFDLLGQGVDGKSPEQRAAFRARLEAAARRIPDRALAGEYRRTLLDRFFAARRAVALPARVPLRPVPTDTATSTERGRILVAILLRHPGLLHDVEHACAELALPTPLGRLRDEIFRWADSTQMLDSAELIDHLNSVGLAAEAAQALSSERFPLPACAAPEAMPAEAEAGWWHYFGLLHGHRIDDEIKAARRACDAAMNQTTQRRLIALCAARAALRGAEQEGAEPAEVSA